MRSSSVIRAAIDDIKFRGFLSFCRCQRISLAKFRFVCCYHDRVGHLRRKKKNIPTCYISNGIFIGEQSYVMATNTRPQRLLHARMVQNFHLVWLDGSIDESNDDFRSSLTKLREVVNTFIDVDECIDFISSIPEDSIRDLFRCSRSKNSTFGR